MTKANQSSFVIRHSSFPIRLHRHADAIKKARLAAGFQPGLRTVKKCVSQVGNSWSPYLGDRCLDSRRIHVSLADHSRGLHKATSRITATRPCAMKLAKLVRLD